MKTSRKFIYLTLCVCLSLFSVVQFSETIFADPIYELQQKNENISADLEEVTNYIQELEEKKDAVTEELSSLEEDLVIVMSGIHKLDEKMKENEQNLKMINARLQNAEEKQTTQYKAMKKRIQYIYENGGSVGWADAFFDGESIENILNNAEFTEQLYEYDRDCLLAYLATVQEVKGIQNEALEVKSSLDTQKQEQEQQKEVLEQLKSEAQQTYDDYENKIDEAKKKADEYTQMIESQNREIQKLIEKQLALSGQSGLISHVEGNEIGAQIANYALQFVGNPYVWGGNSLTNGTDCSGFVHLIYQHFGYSVSRQSALLRGDGKAVSFGEAMPGDIVCYDGHVAIYLGNGQIVHASDSAPYPIGGIKVSPNAAFMTILTIRRIV